MTPRTVLVLPTWYPTEAAPLNAPFVRDHVRAAAAAGHRMVVFLDEGPNERVRGLFELVHDRDGEVRIVRFSYRRGTGRVAFTAAVVRLARILRREGTPVEVIHAHIHPMAWPAAIAGALLRRPFVVSENSSDWPRRTISRAALRRARLALPRAALVCPVNERLRQAIEAYGIRARFRIVPNAVDTSVFRPGPRRDGPAQTLVNVALHVEVKALDVLLRAFQQVAASRPGLRLRLIGEGPLTPDLRRLAGELGVADRVDFEGPAVPAEIAEALRGSDVFVLSSLSENLPLALLEALCCGLPAAATDVGGVPEALGEDGSLAPPGDPAALARAIASVLDGNERYDHEAIARRAAERYSFDAVGAAWDEIYRSL